MNIPLTISVNGERRQIEPGTALDTLVQWSSTPLCEGDRVEVLTAVQGG